MVLGLNCGCLDLSICMWFLVLRFVFYGLCLGVWCLVGFCGFGFGCKVVFDVCIDSALRLVSSFAVFFVILYFDLGVSDLPSPLGFGFSVCGCKLRAESLGFRGMMLWFLLFVAICWKLWFYIYCGVDLMRILGTWFGLGVDDLPWLLWVGIALVGYVETWLCDYVICWGCISLNLWCCCVFWDFVRFLCALLLRFSVCCGVLVGLVLVRFSLNSGLPKFSVLAVFPILLGWADLEFSSC